MVHGGGSAQHGSWPVQAATGAARWATGATETPHNGAGAEPHATRGATVQPQFLDATIRREPLLRRGTVEQGTLRCPATLHADAGEGRTAQGLCHPLLRAMGQAEQR